MAKQEFGGTWTQKKLDRLGKYLHEYAKIMSQQKFRYAYIDAFAGTGYLSKDVDEFSLFPDLSDDEGGAYRAGSATIALETVPEFSKYIFIEKSHERCADLECLRSSHPQIASRIEIVHSDCNEFLMDRCRNYNWAANRAVLFLDPFGMQVDWTTVEAIASTQAIDMWYLFPIGMGVNRLLQKNGHISDGISSRLDKVFGTHEWKNYFYRKNALPGLCGEETVIQKNADFSRIIEFLLGRFRSVFAGVADNPLILRNSRNRPLFLLCFASGNPVGSKIAVKIAKHLLTE